MKLLFFPSARLAAAARRFPSILLVIRTVAPQGAALYIGNVLP